MDIPVLTKEQIMIAIVSRHFDDLEFIESLNSLTFGRKVQLKQQLRDKK